MPISVTAATVPTSLPAATVPTAAAMSAAAVVLSERRSTAKGKSKHRDRCQ
jgi:hypothetical protein